MRVRCTEDDAVMAELIRRELPKDIEKVHKRKGLFEIYAENENDELFLVIGEALEDAADEYGKEHSGKRPVFESETVFRNKGEGASEFLRRIEVE